MFDMQKIGARISALRRSRGMTQTELAERLGISFQAVSSWERGNAMPDVAKLPELARMFGVTIDWMLGSPDAIPASAPEPPEQEAAVQQPGAADAVIELPSAPIAPAVPVTPAVPVPAVATPAPMEKETQPNWNMQELSELLPFLPEKMVNELAQKYCAAHGAEGLDEFMPFMREEDVDVLAREMMARGESIEEVLPFLSEKLVNELAQKHYAAHGAEGLEEFLPFMGEKNVDQLAREWQEQGEDVECLMPFMSHGMLRQLAMEHVQEHGLSGLGRLAKLLDTDTLQDILKKALG